MPLAWNAGKIGVYQTHQHNSFVYKPPQPHRDQRENSCRANALFGKSLSERFAFHDTRRRKPRYPPQPTPSEMSLSCRAARRQIYLTGRDDARGRFYSRYRGSF